MQEARTDCISVWHVVAEFQKTKRTVWRPQRDCLKNVEKWQKLNTNLVLGRRFTHHLDW